ncbi:M48 family peptidase [Polymorphobacter arshaanensis]|uniref:M48 family peptidase n=1 Tax=Glacieibacterium arshaanense TaxID=2511025 RepID=A0A4Y9EL93_9SPHN|nr:M48 family metallopeptidase [Polymorphobacter arshaanensis]TFU01015.1 M48 family peptidase [Polymorphobacter arshaanensis]
MANPAFSVEAATQAYLATVSGVARAKSDAYFEGGYWLILWSFVVTAVIMIFLMRSGWAAKISAWAKRVTGNRPWLHAMLAAFVLIGIVALLQFPWDLYVTYFREHQYGMSNQNFGQWLGDWVKNALISLIVFTLLASGMLRLIRATPKNWWAWGAVVTAFFMAFFIAVAPVFVEPLFNTYKPMTASPLRDQILSMARANGVPAHDVLVVDASRQTKRISANVAGLGSTMRVALNDNLLNQATPAQVRSVMGHELGHYVLNHIWSMVIYFALIILGGYLAINHFVPALLRRNPKWGVQSLADPGALPIAILVISAYFVVMTPLVNTIIRVQEQEADQFGLNAARAPDGFAATAMKLSAYRKLEPGKWEEIIFYDHPSGRTRVETAMQWKAEHLGEPGVE